jgi:cell division protein FtsB
MRKVQLTSI